jgi:hypothetical protein
MRMKTIYGCMRSKEESAGLQQTDRLPEASAFEDDSILRLAYLQEQHQGSAHYDCLIATKVCECSLACPLPGNQLVRIFPCFSRLHDWIMEVHMLTCT